MAPPRPSTQRYLSRKQRARGLRPRDAAVLIVTVWLIAVIVWGVLEHQLDPDNFPTVWLGMWWALQTVTTVGYGDVTPVTTEGRAVAALLLLGGLALISVVTATITSAFITRAQQQLSDSGEDPVIRRLDGLDARLERLEAALGTGPPPPAD